MNKTTLHRNEPEKKAEDCWHLFENDGDPSFEGGTFLEQNDQFAQLAPPIHLHPKLLDKIAELHRAGAFLHQRDGSPPPEPVIASKAISSIECENCGISLPPRGDGESICPLGYLCRACFFGNANMSSPPPEPVITGNPAPLTRPAPDLHAQKEWVTGELQALIDLINDPARFSLLPPSERQHLITQRKIMFDLSDILGERLAFTRRGIKAND